MARVVLDANVLIAAFLSPNGVPAQILLEWRRGGFVLVISPRLIDDVERILLGAKLRARVVETQASFYVARLRQRARLVDDPADVEPVVVADPRDDYLVALARAAGAHVIVTGDAHLLELTDLQPPAYSPREFLARLLRH